jgi:hypothetical protein
MAGQRLARPIASARAPLRAPSWDYPVFADWLADVLGTGHYSAPSRIAAPGDARGRGQDRVQASPPTANHPSKAPADNRIPVATAQSRAGERKMMKKMALGIAALAVATLTLSGCALAKPSAPTRPTAVKPPGVRLG